MGGYYFLACLLPPLPFALGEKLVVPFPEITRIVRRNTEPSDAPLLQAQLSVLDAANWENFDQGRDHFLEGGALTREQMKNKQDLPAFIRQFMDEKEREIRYACIYDRLWELCYKALQDRAQEAGCRYLMDYSVWEINLRNRLTALRLRESEGNVADHAVLPDSRVFDFSSLLSRVDSQKSPLEAERIIDIERLKWIAHCQGADPFSFDAILAFVASAAIYDRWERLGVPFDVNHFLYSGG